MEPMPNSRFITIINNIDSSIVDRIELTDTFYVNLNLFLEKYKGSNEDYAKLICNDKIINTINIFNVDEDFTMPDDIDIIYMIKSYKKYVYIINDNGEYKITKNKEYTFCDNYYYIIFFLPIQISYENIIHYNRKELITSLSHYTDYRNYDSNVFQYISEMIHPHEYDDYDFMLNILSHCEYFDNMYFYTSDRLKNSEKFILELISLNPYILNVVNFKMKNNYNIVLAAVTSNSGDGKILLFASDELKDNYDIVLAAVKHNGRALQFASSNLQDNYDIVLAAINSNYDHVIEYASNNLRNNYNIILAAVNKYGYSLQYASDTLKDNYDIVLAAVKYSGRELYYASDRLKDNCDIVLAAYNRNHFALQYASDRIQKIIET